MIGITAPITCLMCGSPVTMHADGTSDGVTARCIVRCTECRGEHLLTVRLELDTRTCLTPARRAALARIPRGPRA